MARRPWSSRDAGEDYADWAGGAWADEHVAIRHPTLAETVGLDAHRWRIIAIDLEASPGGEDEIILTAREIGTLSGGEAAVEFHVTGVTVADFIAEVFTDFRVSLTARDATRAEVTVTERRELRLPLEG